MVTIKSFSDLQQSRKLAEILPLESADMFYDGVQDLYKEKVYNIPTDGSSITVRTGHVITDKGIKANLLLPCWSLAALLEVLPDCTIIAKDETDTENEKYMCVAESKDDIINTFGNNPVDACVAMIEKLNELNLL